MRRELSPTPVKLPGQDSSCAVGDTRYLQERRRAPEQRFDQHLQDSGLRSAASRAYAGDIRRRIVAKDAAMAASRGDLEDFLKFCPGAGKIEALTPSPSATTAKRQIAQDAGVIWTWRFNPMTNAMEQVPVKPERSR